jgi:hypothetical protein
MMNRKQFLRSAGKMGICACAAAAGLKTAMGQTAAAIQAKPGDKTAERAVNRMEFSDLWVKRFFGIMDQTVDAETRKKLMVANGRACYRDWIRESRQEVKPVDFDAWAEKARKAVKREGFSVEGRVIHFQYDASAETGAASPEGICLCPMVESKPAGMSTTYCLCSTGYVKEMHELLFSRKVDVELLESVLGGGQRCKFKITVS